MTGQFNVVTISYKNLHTETWGKESGYLVLSNDELCDHGSAVAEGVMKINVIVSGVIEKVAKLIAAAPELLESLIVLNQAAYDEHGLEKARVAATNAIKKATE